MHVKIILSINIYIRICFEMLSIILMAEEWLQFYQTYVDRKTITAYFMKECAECGRHKKLSI
jgi:hypothetical protein